MAAAQDRGGVCGGDTQECQGQEGEPQGVEVVGGVKVAGLHTW